MDLYWIFNFYDSVQFIILEFSPKCQIHELNSKPFDFTICYLRSHQNQFTHTLTKIVCKTKQKIIIPQHMLDVKKGVADR